MMPLLNRSSLLANTACLILGSFSLSQAAGQSSVTGQLVRIGQSDEQVRIAEIRSTSEWISTGQPIDVQRVVRFGNPALILEGSVVLLDDGSRLVAKELEVSGTTLSGHSKAWEMFELPLRPIKGILLASFQNADETNAALDAMAAFGGTSDQLVLANGDTLEGTFRRLTPLEVEWQVGQTISKLSRRRVNQIRLASASGQVVPPAKAVWVGLADGTLLLGNQLELKAERLRLSLVGGAELESSPIENIANHLVYLRPASTPAAYLSDLETLGFRHLPFLGTQWQYGTDRDVHGGTLASGGLVSQKGIGLHSTSRIAYAVPSGHSRFRAKIGIDDSAASSGSVVFRVYTSEDGKKWNSAYESPVVRGRDQPLPIDIPLEGIRGIALVVDYADGADVLDRANWHDARFEPE